MWGENRYSIVIFISLFYISSCYAVESSISPHYGTGQETTLYYWETNGSDIMRVYLLPCDILDSGIECEDIRESNRILETNITGDGSLSITISGFEGIYRVCVKLKNSGKQDCDKDNYYMLSEGGCVVYEQVVEQVQVVEQIIDEIKVELVYVPSEIFTNTSFISYVNISNQGGMKNVTTYSYLYNGSNCISGNWLDNKRDLVLEDNFTIVSFENMVEWDTEPGEYKFKVRVNWNETKYDSQPFTVNVQRKEFSELRIYNVTVSENSSFNFFMENRGNVAANITIIIDSENWTLNETLDVAGNSTINFSIRTPPYESRVSTYVISENIIFDSRVFRKEQKDKISLQSEQNEVSFQEESFLYAVLSCFTLIALSALVWGFVRR